MTNALNSVQVALGADFLTAFSKLPQAQQKKVRTFLDKFTSIPDASAVNYEKIKATKDPNLRSVRIDQDYRGIVLAPQKGNVYVLLWVDKHDAAYHWAERRTCSIHPTTGTMQVVLTEEAAESVVQESAAKPSQEGYSSTVASSEHSSAAPVSVASVNFGDYTDDDLLSLGVPSSMLVHVRAVTAEDQLNRLDSILPREAFEGIFMLAAGYTLEEARAELGITKAKSVDTTDFAAAVQRDGTRRQFVVITDAVEMEKILAAPLEKWRVFLHPSQRKLVSADVPGPVRVLGSAGTGKTVVAMHRAVWLVRNVCGPQQKVLFTTFTRNLAADIADGLKKLCSIEEFERIEVINLDAWAKRFLDNQDFSLKLSYSDNKQKDAWNKALEIRATNLPFTEEFLLSEWNNVVQAHGIETWEAYKVVSRVGRSQRLTRQERQEIWPFFEEYRALLNENGLCEPADAFRAAARLIAARNVAQPYRSVLVDEAQDFGNEAFRLIRTLVPPAANDLFIVGDAHQRIYGHQVVLSRCGIDIRGRGKKLRINYRTTEELKNWSMGLLKGLSFDDLDAGTDDGLGVRSLIHGEPPEVHLCATTVAAALSVSAHLHALMQGGSRPEDICVVAHTHRELEDLQRFLSQSDPSLSIHQIETGKADDGTIPGLRLATIHRVKGLEFDHIILHGNLENIDSVREKNSEATLKCRALLYVAATRARKSLCVCQIAQ